MYNQYDKLRNNHKIIDKYFEIRYGNGVRGLKIEKILNENEIDYLLKNNSFFFNENNNLIPIIKIYNLYSEAYLLLNTETDKIYFINNFYENELFITALNLTTFLINLETGDYYIAPKIIKEIKLSKKAIEKLNKLLENNQLEKYFFNYEFVFEKKYNFRSGLQNFLTLDDIKETYELYVSDERISKNIIPIISDGADNYLCISVRKHDFGSVFFFHHDTYEDEKSLFKLAKSLEEFYKILKYVED